MEVLQDPYSPPILVPNAQVLEILEQKVQQNDRQLKKEKRQEKKAGSGNNSKSSNSNRSSKFPHRDWIQQEALEYLKTMPCVELDTRRMDELKATCMMASSSKSKQRARGGGRLGQPHSSSTASSNSGGDTKVKQEDDDDRTTKIQSGYELTEAEAVQVLNMMPRSMVEVHLLVEDAHTRIGDEKEIAEFLETIETYRRPTTKKDKENEQDDDDHHDDQEQDEQDDADEEV